jgi:hypothetical protein
MLGWSLDIRMTAFINPKRSQSRQAEYSVITFLWYREKYFGSQDISQGISLADETCEKVHDHVSTISFASIFLYLTLQQWGRSQETRVWGISSLSRHSRPDPNETTPQNAISAKPRPWFMILIAKRESKTSHEKLAKEVVLQGSLQLNVVLLHGDVGVDVPILITEELLIEVVRINIIATNFFILIVTGHITAFFWWWLASSSSDVPHDAGLVSMGQFASFVGTCTCVAEVGAFIDMALCAACTILTIAIDAEGSTN